MKKYMRPILLRLPALLLMLLLCAVAVMYLYGWFDISMIVRGKDAETSPPVSTSDTDASATETGAETDTKDTAAPDTASDETSDTSAPPDTAQPNDGEFTLSPLPDGYEVSYAEWTPDGEWTAASKWTLCELDGADELLPGYYSSHTTTEFDISYTNSGEGKQNDVVYTPYETDSPAVYTYMGLLIVETETDGVYNIVDVNGTCIGSFDESVIVPAYCRDKYGNPLFETVGEHGIGTGDFYVINGETHAFEPADYIPEVDGRGVRFDYAPDYGAPSDSRTFVSRKSGNGYELALADEGGKRLRDYKYTAAYQFSEERAAVFNENGEMYYISRSGSTAIKSARSRKIPSQDRTVVDILLRPLTDGEESIGFYYYDHGLVRARVLSANYYRYHSKNETYAQSDENIIMTMEGERFYIPAGYEVKAYSNGMLLLRGKYGYGYMDFTGRWVVDPDLDMATPFSEGLAAIKKDGECALIDESGSFVIPYGVYEHIEEPSTGIIAAYGNGKWTILAKASPTVLPEDENS